MKKLLLIFSLAIVAAACSNDGTKSASTSDSTNTTTVETPATAPTENTATNTTPTTTGGANLMDLMNKNMQEMKAMPSSGNPDNDFASMMKTHHLGAIEMAQVQVAQGSDAQLKQMAQKMIEDQQKDVAEFNQFVSGHNAHGGGDAFHKEVMAKMNSMSMDMDMSGSVDKQFAQMMIQHHQGAIDMSNAYLKTGAHEEKMKAMANKIKATNQKEKEDLQAWLAKNK
jgi:uncharacterized protein (DUF305 family)